MPARDETMTEALAKAGIDREVTQAALEIDAVLQRWRRRFSKRELGRSALTALGLDHELDLAQLDVLIAIWAPTNEFGSDTGQETMVATVAERLGIDPSRASRMVSDVSGRGVARRKASNQDARRTILTLTERGEAIILAVRRFKFLVMGEFLSDWTAEEIRTFLPLLERFSAWTDEAATIGPERFSDELADLSATLKRAMAD